MKKKYEGIEEIEMHYLDEPEKHLGSISVPIYQTSLFSRKKGDYGYRYSRISNPTIEVPEKKLAKMEKGDDALLFSSGMAAITSAIMYYVKSQSHIVCVKDVYLSTENYISKYLNEKFGVESSFFNGGNYEEFESVLQDNTDIIYLETCVSNVFTIPHIEKICIEAKKRGAKVIVDNTYATPIFCNPIELGADIVVHSCSKYIGGHSDIIGGVLVADAHTIQSIKHNERSMLGACIDPHQAWLILRSLRTLHIRMEKHMENGLALANYLNKHPNIDEVIYPALENHPQHDYAEHIFKGYPGLFCFIPKGGIKKAKELYNLLQYPEKGPSWGGFETLTNTPGFWEGIGNGRNSDIKQGSIRISVGLEDINTIISDFEQAFNKTYI